MAETPRRRQTRSISRANTPQAAPALPALNTAANHSYGSRGKVVLKHQVATEKTNLAEVFEANRNPRRTSAIPEEDEEDEEDEEEEQSVAGTQSEVPEDDQGVLDQGDRNATGVYSEIAYDPSIHGSRPGTREGRNSMPPPARPVRPVRTAPRSTASLPARAIPGLARPVASPPARPPPRAAATPPLRPASRARSPRPVYNDDAEPEWLSIFLTAVPRYLWRNFWALMIGALLLSTFTLMPLPNSIGSHRDRVVRASKSAWGVPGYDISPEKLEQLWNLLRYNQSLVDAGLPPVGADDHQWHVNQAMQQQMSETSQDNLAMRWDMDEIKQYIPDKMAVDVIDGQMVIKEDFWQALVSKFQDSPEAFEAFMERNQYAVENHISRSASRYLKDQMTHQKVISRSEALHLLEQEHQTRMTELTSAMSSLRHDTLTDARAIASEVATSILTSSHPTARGQMSVLARSHVLQNTLEALNMINYFSPNLGARIDHGLTSPTKEHPNRKPSAYGFQSIMEYMGYRPIDDIEPNSAINALTPWTEMGDCWCAPPSPPPSHIHGAAQLAIFLPHDMIPSRLILDHIPARGTVGIASAPRKWELWASFSNSVHAASAQQFIASELQRNGRLGTKDTSCFGVEPPTEYAVCVGQGGYDIHGDNWVQSEELFVDLGKIELGVNKVIFRVTENWGGEFTCLYRVRLAGKELEFGAEEIEVESGM